MKRGFAGLVFAAWLAYVVWSITTTNTLALAVSIVVLAEVSLFGIAVWSLCVLFAKERE